jgi:hypothetical protein
VNLFTLSIQQMKKEHSLEDRLLRFQKQLLSMIETIDDLLEDPLFQDSISGAEEVSLDQARELFDSICNNFENPGRNIMTVDEMIAQRIPDET